MRKLISMCIVGLALSVAIAATPIFSPGPTCDTCVPGPTGPAVPKPKPPQQPRPTECPSAIHPNHYACCEVHPEAPTCR